MKNFAVVLKINDGNFTEGFTLYLQILEDGAIIREDYSLPPIPPAPNIPELYCAWQNLSRQNSRQLQAVTGQLTHISLTTCQDTASKLEAYCREWFNHIAFNSVRDRILANVPPQIISTSKQSLPIIIESNRNQPEIDIIRRLPWHLWDLFNKLTYAEFA